MSGWRKIRANGPPNEERSPKSCHRMAAKGIQPPWRWDCGMISTNLDGIWGMSAKALCPAGTRIGGGPRGDCWFEEHADRTPAWSAGDVTLKGEARRHMIETVAKGAPSRWSITPQQSLPCHISGRALQAAASSSTSWPSPWPPALRRRPNLKSASPGQASLR